MKRMVLKSTQLIDKSSALDGLIAREVNKSITKKVPHADQVRERTGRHYPFSPVAEGVLLGHFLQFLNRL